MKRFKVLCLIAACLVTLFYLAGCSEQKEESSSTVSAGNRYDWDTSQIAEKETLQILLRPNTINGEPLDYENPTVTYDGQPIACDFSLHCDGAKPINCLFFLTVNGYIQPFRMEGSDEEQTFHTLPVKEEDFQRLSFVIDRPVFLSSQQSSYVTVHVLANYDQVLERETDVNYYNLSIYEFFRIPPVKPEWAATEDAPPSASMEEVDAIQTETQYLNINGIFYHTININEKGEGALFLQYMQSETPEDYFLALQQGAGHYRTVLMRDGAAVEAFGGKTYLDWESSGEETYWEVPISPDVLEQGSHVYWVITYNLDIMGGDTTQVPFFATDPYTIAVS